MGTRTGGRKHPWHRGSYAARAALVRAEANANPATTCWRCKRTMSDIRKVRRDAEWTAGHVIDSDPRSPLAAECSPCNYSAGAHYGNRLRRQGKRPGDPPPTRGW